MATPLHDVEALVAIAQGPTGPAQDWAASRLAIVAPKRFSAFPSGEGPHDEVFAAAPPALVPRLIDALKAPGAVPLGLAASAAALGAFGALPADRGPLATALRSALRGDGGEADLWVAWALSSLGEADAHDLAKANGVDSAERVWLLPGIVLRVAEHLGALDDASREVARALGSAGDPRVLVAVLSGLGLPTPDVTDLADPLEVAAQATRSAGGTFTPKAHLGSRRRQVQGLVLDLCEGVPGPGAALLRALYAQEADPRWGLVPVAVAAWLRAFVPGDPIDDVLDRLGGADPDRLSRARSSVRAEHRGKILAALRKGAGPTAGVLAMPLLEGDPELATAVVDLLLGSGTEDVRADALGSAAAWHCADLVPGWLANRASRDLGLLVAEWVPTEEVLAALLDLAVPADPDPRTQYARCLAAMGDPATVPALSALVEGDEAGDFAGARELAEAILQIPLGGE